MSYYFICKILCIYQGLPGKSGETGPQGPPGAAVSKFTILTFFVHPDYGRYMNKCEHITM